MQPVEDCYSSQKEISHILKIADSFAQSPSNPL